MFDDVRQLDFCLPQPAKVMHWEMSTLEGFALLHTWPGYAVRQVGASSCTRLVLPLHLPGIGFREPRFAPRTCRRFEACVSYGGAKGRQMMSRLADSLWSRNRCRLVGLRFSWTLG